MSSFIQLLATAGTAVCAMDKYSIEAKSVGKLDSRIIAGVYVIATKRLAEYVEGKLTNFLYNRKFLNSHHYNAENRVAVTLIAHILTAAAALKFAEKIGFITLSTPFLQTAAALGAILALAPKACSFIATAIDKAIIPTAIPTAK